MPTPDEVLDEEIYNKYLKPYMSRLTDIVEESKPKKKIALVQFDEYGNEVLLDTDFNIIEQDEN